MVCIPRWVGSGLGGMGSRSDEVAEVARGDATDVSTRATSARSRDANIRSLPMPPSRLAYERAAWNVMDPDAPILPGSV